MSPATARAQIIQPKPRPLRQYPAGPFVGMRDSRDPSASRPEYARLLSNVYPQDPQFGGAIVGRPGFTLTGAGGVQQGGAGSDRTGQLVYQLTKLDGTEITFRIVGGKIDAYTWSTDTWANVVTAANLVTASIALSATARCYAVTFANTVVISDGVNVPFTWDGTAGAGGLLELTNAPVAFGAPAVYYGKLFLIKNTDRATIVWSEENQPNTGYEAGGYNNAWTLGQTDQEALFALLGTNDALYTFRARSTGAIVGAVTPDFRTTGTREGVSETEGTNAPGSVFSDGRRIFFTNPDGQSHMIVPGAGVVELWSDYGETIRALDPEQVDDCEGFYDPTLGLARFGYTELGQTLRGMQLTFNAQSELPQAAGLFEGYTWSRVGMVKDGDLEPRVMHIDGSGYVYAHGDPLGGPWDDGLQTGTVGITHEVESSYHGQESFDEKHWSRLDFSFRAASDASFTIGYETPRGISSGQLATLSGGGALWDEGFWDVDSWASESLEQHLAVGIAGNGRWLVWRIQHQGMSEEFGLTVATTWSHHLGPFPLTP